MWHGTSVCELILVMFGLFVSIPIHDISILLWKMDMELKMFGCVSTVFGRQRDNII